MLTDRVLKKVVDEINALHNEPVVGVELPDGWKYPEGAKNYVIVKDKRLIKRFLKNPEMAFGEGYMNGELEIKGDLEEVLAAGLQYLKTSQGKHFPFLKLFKVFSYLNPEQDKKNIEYHYDIGNDFYKLWLDKSLTYSCAYFCPPDIDLEEAQRRKREVSLKKLQLNENDTLLDIGCGWGSVLFDAVEKFNVKKAVGITLSENQYTHIKEEVQKRGYKDKVDVYLIHYKDLPKLGLKFTKVVSIGMFEHVGLENYRKFFETVYKVMEDGGLFLLHTIGKFHPEKPSEWIRKYIFPGGYLPSLEEIFKSLEGLNFYLIDIDNWRLHYYKTLKEWKRRFLENKKWVLENLGERFFRMWEFYLTAAAVSFFVGSNYVFQILLSKNVVNNYPVIEYKFHNSLL